MLIFPKERVSRSTHHRITSPASRRCTKIWAFPVTPVALNTGLIWKPKRHHPPPTVMSFKVLPPIPGLPRDEFMRVLEERIESESKRCYRQKSVANRKRHQHEAQLVLAHCPIRAFIALAAAGLHIGILSRQPPNSASTPGSLNNKAQAQAPALAVLSATAFPTLLRLELQDASYARACARRLARGTARLDLHLNLTNTEHVTLSQSRIAISRSNGAVTNVTADALIATIRMKAAALATRHRGRQPRAR